MLCGENVTECINITEEQHGKPGVSCSSKLAALQRNGRRAATKETGVGEKCKKGCHTGEAGDLRGGPNLNVAQSVAT